MYVIKAGRAAALRRAATLLPETTRTGPTAELAEEVEVEPAGHLSVCLVKVEVLDV